MTIRRAIFACLMALCMGLTGPVTHALAGAGVATGAAQRPDAAADPAAETLQAAEPVSIAAPAKRCKRGSLAAPSCNSDRAPPPGDLEISAPTATGPMPVRSGMAFKGTGNAPILRPPRSA